MSLSHEELIQIREITSRAHELSDRKVDELRILHLASLADPDDTALIDGSSAFVAMMNDEGISDREFGHGVLVLHVMARNFPAILRNVSKRLDPIAVERHRNSSGERLAEPLLRLMAQAPVSEFGGILHSSRAWAAHLDAIRAEIENLSAETRPLERALLQGLLDEIDDLGDLLDDRLNAGGTAAAGGEGAGYLRSSLARLRFTWNRLKDVKDGAQLWWLLDEFFQWLQRAHPELLPENWIELG